MSSTSPRDGFEVYAGDDSLLQGLLRIGGAGLHHRRRQRQQHRRRQVVAHWQDAEGEAAQRR